MKHIPTTFFNYRYFYRSSILIAKKNYYYNNFSSFENNTRKINYFINSLTKTDSVIFPTLPNSILFSNFSFFFQDKVSNIISKIKLITNNVAFIPLRYDILPGYGIYVNYFSSTSFSEVLDIMLASNRLLQSIHCLYIFFISLLLLTPFIFNIINISLDSGIVPSSLKHAIIKPILKKLGLDIECLSKYRPISQLPRIRKILERIVSKQLINYLNANSLFDTRQSAYREFHSPETLLPSILDDFLNNLDNNSNIQLILLYLSAAFDTIAHSILIKRLEDIGIL